MAQITVNETTWYVEQRGQGMPLLLVHGFPLDHTMWSGQIETFADRAHVIAPDLRGFGRSELGSEPLTMAQLADDLAALLEALDVKDPVTLCGLSMGGYVAWEFWQRHGAHLRRLILCDTRAAADDEAARQARFETAERVRNEGSGILAEAMLPKLFAPATIEDHPDRVEAARRVMAATDRHAAAAALEGMAARRDFTPLLPEISVPSLVVCGVQDAITPATEMKAISDALPNAQFVPIQGAGHMAPLEQPDAVNRAIVDFLSE